MNLFVKDVKTSSYRKNVEKEFYESFKKFLWMNQLFCAAPLCLNLDASPSGTKMKIFSSFHMFYGVLIGGCVSTATFWQHQQFDTSIGFLTGVLYMSEYIIGTFSLLLVIIGCYYNRRTYKMIFGRLVNVDLKLQECGVLPNFDSTRVYLKRGMILFTIFFTIVVVVDIMSNDPRADSFIISSSVYTIPNLITTLALMQYVALLHYLQDKLKTINSVLQQVASTRIFDYHQQMVNNKLSVISVFSGNNMNTGHNGIEKILNTLRKQHAELLRLMELLCNRFGLLIILTFCAAYVALSSQLYEFYKISVGFDNVFSWLTVYTILWVIMNFGKILLIVHPTNNFVDERKRTGYLIYKIDAFRRNSSNTRLHLMLKMFSDQLLHETSSPNAMRIINLDMTILATMLGVLTTYLIILIQFDISAREQVKVKGISNITNAT